MITHNLLLEDALYNLMIKCQFSLFPGYLL